MIDNIDQFIHILLHFPGDCYGLVGKILDSRKFLLAGFYFLVNFIRFAGDGDDGVGQLFMLTVRSTDRIAEYSLCGTYYLLRNIHDFFRLMLQGQVERADLHDGVDIFLKNFCKLLPSAGQPLIDTAQLWLGRIVSFL